MIWSERYDREMADVFEVQDEIALKIGGAKATSTIRALAWALALGSSLGAVGSAPDEAPGAFDGVSNG